MFDGRPLTRWAITLVLVFAPAAARGGGLQLKVEQLISAAGLKNTSVALLITDLNTGDELATIEANQPMVPASNMKLLITAAALHLLGPDYVFRTELRLIEPQDWVGMTLPAVVDEKFDPRGDPVLVVVGDGDPAFCDPKVLRQHDLNTQQLLQAWIDVIRGTGLKGFQMLLMDDRVFDHQFVHPSWPVDQFNAWYSAQVAGINFNDNCLDVYVEPTTPAQTPEVYLFPSSPFLSPLNRAVTGKSDTFWISRKIDTNELTFWGQVKNNRTAPFHVTIHDPPIFLGHLMEDRLTTSGTRVRSLARPARDDLLPPGRLLHAVQTTLPLVLQRCNKDSQNLFAEALLKRMGRAFTGTPGSWGNGTAAMRAFLNRLIGPRSATVIVADGSGLSRDNRVTARILVELLTKMHRDPLRGPLFRESLSIGGTDGTLRNRFHNGRGRVYGKSGYINGVSCLSGYLVMPADTGGPDTGDHTVAFSLLFNGIKPPVYAHHIKRLQDKIVNLIEQEVLSRSSLNVKIGG